MDTHRGAAAARNRDGGLRAVSEPPRGRHITSAYAAAQIRPTNAFSPHSDAQATETVGVNPDPPEQESRSVPADTSLPLTAGSPTGFTPFMNQY